MANFLSNNVSVLLGNGSGGFGPTTNYIVDSDTRSVAIGDFNRDTHPDLAVANSFSNVVSVLRGNGDGTFGPPTTVAAPGSSDYVTVGDFNLDTNLDTNLGLALIHNFQNTVSVLPGNGNGGFGAASSFGVGSFARGIAVGDYNRDGGPDLAVANGGSNNVSVLLNNCRPATTPTSTSTVTATATRTSNPVTTATQTSTAVTTATSTATGTATRTITSTATGTATGTAVTTATSTYIATGTTTATTIATGTPTVCAITFSDVHPTDYFYEPVSYLYCHEAISGYGDNTFRPYNNTTRGQLAKIVVLAEGWPIYTPPTPTFRDVPPTDPFYTLIETAYNQGIISGYNCGTGCLEYRPGNNITRAQLCKIVVLAENWPITPPTVPTFRDVPQGDAFYGFIETAYAQGIISGYNCDTGCLEFRPGNNATRGQICKIVYLAVTQGQAYRE